jgi:hypothetical protein
LTKADAIEKAEFEHWQRIINNKAHVLRHGYYVTGFPSSADNEKDWEIKGFKKEIWGKVDSSRLGIPNLMEALSEELAKMIIKSFALLLCYANTHLIRLPGIKEKVSHKMREIQADLEGLPQSFADNPQEKLLGVVNKFHWEVDELTNTKSRQPLLCQNLGEDYLNEYTRLSSQLQATEPKFEVQVEDKKEKDEDSDSKKSSSSRSSRRKASGPEEQTSGFLLPILF